MNSSIDFGRKDAPNLCGTLLVQERLAEHACTVDHTMNSAESRLGRLDRARSFARLRNISGNHTNSAPHASIAAIRSRMRASSFRATRVDHIARDFGNDQAGVVTKSMLRVAWIARWANEACFGAHAPIPGASPSVRAACESDQNDHQPRRRGPRSSQSSAAAGPFRQGRARRPVRSA